MSKPYTKHRKFYKQKEYDFVPNKAQIINGAFLDLGRPTNSDARERAARSIAIMWNEDI